MSAQLSSFWQYTPEGLFAELGSSLEGLSSTEANRRWRSNKLSHDRPSWIKALLLFMAQFKKAMVEVTKGIFFKRVSL